MNNTIRPVSDRLGCEEAIYIDSAISATLMEQLATFKLSALSQFNLIIPLALGVVIAVTVVTIAINWFRRLAGV